MVSIPNLIFSLLTSATFFQHIRNEIFLIFFIFAKIFTQLAFVHVPKVSILNDRGTECDTTTAWLWCGPTHLYLTLWRVTRVRHHITTNQLRHCLVIFFHFEGTVLNWRKVLEFEQTTWMNHHKIDKQPKSYFYLSIIVGVIILCFNS